MDHKRYQIFLSSTLSDLEAERRMIMQTLLELDCIPSGMEFFPASDEETFDFIKTVIDTCDYYILVVAGRYGSVAPDGTSYTEKEYDYAVSSGKPVLGFVRKDLSQITVSKTDENPDLAQKLAAFRSKVSSGRIVKMWDNADQLAGLVATTLTSAIKRYPAVGWIRGDKEASSTILTEINSLRKQNDELKKLLSETKPKLIDGLADLDDKYTIKYSGKSSYNHSSVDRTISISLGDILKAIGAKFRTPSNTSGLSSLESYIEKYKSLCSISIDYSCKVEILTQFEIIGIMSANTYNLKNGGTAIFHHLTERGLQEYLRRMAILKADTSLGAD